MATAQLFETDGHGEVSRERWRRVPAAAGPPCILRPGRGRRALGEP
ncbi:hypothetical protein F750_2284 [Streptomyces sp. PAMC 26508]|nr:hypothetical protein F750_2284 [Streptomyces sp. PAMC 26508]